MNSKAHELVKELDDDTIMRLNFNGHCDQFLYRFPSGLMVLVWGDSSIGDGQLGVMREDYCREKLESRDPDQLELVDFEDSPFAEGWS